MSRLKKVILLQLNILLSLSKMNWLFTFNRSILSENQSCRKMLPGQPQLSKHYQVNVVFDHTHRKKDLYILSFIVC